MKIETIGSFASITNRIDKKGKDMSDFLSKIASELNSKIQRRVQANGKGSDGNNLKRYSKTYANTRERLGYQSRFRDLTRTGKMWQSLTTAEVGKNKVEMLFGGAEEKAKAAGNDKRTPFFSLAPGEQAYLQRRLEEFAKV